MLLYTSELLPECYAVGLMAGLLGLTIEVRHIDCYPGHEHREAAFLAVNPAGTLPVLVDEEAVITDWQAALVYLAMAYDPAQSWLAAADAGRSAGVRTWLGFARKLELSSGQARLHDAIALPVDVACARARAHDLLRTMERHLWFAERGRQAWLLEGELPTIADLAVFVHVALCEEGGVARMNYPTVRRWMDRFRRLAGFVPMGGMFALPPLEAPATAC